LNRALVAAALVAVAASAVACTSSGGESTTAPVSSPAPPATASVSGPASSSVPVSTAAPSSTPVSTPSSTSAPPSRTSSTSPTTSPAPTGPPACAQTQLKLTPVRGGAFQGREIAGVLFTNTSSSTCVLRGYPAAQLIHKENNLGQPAVDNRGPVRTIVLKSGAAGQVQLTAVTTCQSAISDHVRIRVPQSTTSTDVAMELRGCLLSVDPFEAA
jgi:hypothetical protein